MPEAVGSLSRRVAPDVRSDLRFTVLDTHFIVVTFQDNEILVGGPLRDRYAVRPAVAFDSCGP